MGTNIAQIGKETAWDLRHKVMWPEKDIEYIKLADDDQGIHYGLFREESLLSVISLFINNEEAQFRKFATLIEEQGKGYGSQLLSFVLDEAKKEGVTRIWCNARENKKEFYLKFGLFETNMRFERGGKCYIIMEKRL